MSQQHSKQKRQERQWRCQGPGCSNLLSLSDNKKYRLRYFSEEQVRALPEEVRKAYEGLKGRNLCPGCAGLARAAGLQVVTVATIKEWKQKKAANKLLQRLSDEKAEKLNGLKAELEAEAGEGKDRDLRVVN